MNTIQARLPPGTRLAWQAFRTDVSPDASRVPEALRTAPLARRASYFAGRECAVRALAEAGHASPTVLGRTPQGLPDWPAGLTGSITHAILADLAEPAGLAMALIGSAQDFRSLAIDLEPVMTMEQAEQIGTVALSPNEARLGQRLKMARPPWVTQVYCLKETLFKLLFCEAGTTMPFEAAELLSFDAASGKAGLILCRDWGGIAAGTRFWLGSQEIRGCVLAHGAWPAAAAGQ